MVESTVDDARGLIENLLDELGMQARVSFSCNCDCPNSFPTDRDELVADVLGYAREGVVYLCLPRIKVASSIFLVEFAALLRYVFYHELCHVILGTEGWERIPWGSRPDEAFCEYVALKALQGRFVVGDVNREVQAVYESILRRIAGLPRPEPYSNFTAYLLSEIVEDDPLAILVDLAGFYGVKPQIGGELRRVVLCG